MKYNWQLKDWRKFRYDLQGLEGKLMIYIEEAAHLGGMLKALPDDLQIDAVINTLLNEAIKTSEIEGEYLSRAEVLSSIRNNLGLNVRKEKLRDKRAKGIGELLITVRNSFSKPLTEKMLLNWHLMLMSYNSRLNTGIWRTHDEPMQVVSGPIGREKIHFEAPPSYLIPAEMKIFISWFNDTAPGGSREIIQAPVRSAIAHLYFESIHPFEDGNGRIGRVIAEKALAQTTGRPVILSLSQIIESKKKDYYKALERAQKSNELTEWIHYFVNVVIEAQTASRKMVEFTLKKTRFFDLYNEVINERQAKVLRKMLEAGPDGFTGGMTAGKYMSITRTSKATATRDLQYLVELDILKPSGGGRSVHYTLTL